MNPTDKAHIEEIRALKAKSTPVVAWYPRPVDGVIKGPWNRWFSSIGPEEEHRCNGKLTRAAAEDDINYAAAAMNEVPNLLDLIERQERMIARAREGLRFYEHAQKSFDPDQTKLKMDLGTVACDALADLDRMERSHD